MTYDSIITFTLDTICPWTYIGYTRVQKALSKYRAENLDSQVSFTLKLAPYQLYPDFSKEGEDKYEWYKNTKYDGDEGRMKMFVAYMTDLAAQDDISLNFTGKFANTLQAHRVLTYIQTIHSPEKGCLALESLYKSYFSDSAHPSSESTLLKACLAAGLSQEEAEKVVRDEDMGMLETKEALREQVGNAVDSVPYVVFEGRRRDFTLIGAKSVEEYGKCLAQVEKEAK